MKRAIKKIVDKLPYVKGLKAQLDQLHVPPGHYYSPTISKEDLVKRSENIWKDHPREIIGLDLNEESQLNLLNEFAAYYKELPFEATEKEGLRYYYENRMYSYSDAIFLFCMLRKSTPKRIIEVGSGFSSAVTLDTNNLFFDNNMECTFIEPYPERLNSLLFESDSIRLLQKPVQDVELSLFEELEANDILFIDSTHVSKTGSDVNFLMFDVLPRLKKGVKIHFHDIFYPFEYPKRWVIDGKRSWNEDYLLRAFLAYNAKFKIIAFNTFLEEFHEDWFKANMPLCLKNRGGSIWLEVQ
ncbi:class I SAM-dependent methyltransferase [Psychroserpens luteolus]|uniref:class I SAM-dependent methyltransferase n=1 Tax=Psychroserpens luteolus TaxID=2855840 RepID=UPI001E29CB40|nr:class I SAM-dependent methyltransferase [Psychroserpens luteolus]MCD2257785.1 class I SAM-dependent methyltransferase [Psychroserpens luteolus]